MMMNELILTIINYKDLFTHKDMMYILMVPLIFS